MSKNLVIWCGKNAYEYWDERSYDTGLSEKQGGIGGSESWVIEMAPRFAANGYNVHIFNYCSEERKDSRSEGVTWHPFGRLDEWAANNEIDTLLGFRQVDVFHKPHIKARQCFALAEDTVFHPNQNYPVNLPHVKTYIALCPYHKEFMHMFHGVPKEKIWIGKNGVDLDLYKRAKAENKKEKNRFFYSSSLDRGVDNLLQFIWPAIKAELPDASLHIYYGFNNWEKGIDYNSDYASTPHPVDMQIRWIKNLIKSNKPNDVHFYGRVNKWTLAQEQAKCEMHLYPGFFAETFCSTYLEAMAADAAVVTTNIWAGRRTAKAAAALIDVVDMENFKKNFYLEAYGSAYNTSFVKSVLKLAQNRELLEQKLEAQRKHVAKFSWDASFAEYLDLFEGKFYNEKNELINFGFDL